MNEGVLVSVLLLGALVGCNDPAKPDYQACMTFATAGDYGNASLSCTKAKLASPESKYGKLAQKKLDEMKPKLDEMEKANAAAQEGARWQAEQEQHREAAAQAALWKTMPTKLNKRIYAQAASDLTSGGATPVLTVITSEMGQPPAGTYSDAVSVWYVWGAQLGAKPSNDEIKKAPFAVRTLRDLTCGDYSPSQVEFWLNGERKWPE